MSLLHFFFKVPHSALRSLPRATRKFKHAIHSNELDLYHHEGYDHSQWQHPSDAIKEGDAAAHDPDSDNVQRVGVVKTHIDEEYDRARKVLRIEMRRRRKLAALLSTRDAEHLARCAMWSEEKHIREELDSELMLLEEQLIAAQKEGYTTLRELAAGCIRIGVPQLTRFKWMRTLNCQGNIRGGMHLVLDVATGTKRALRVMDVYTEEAVSVYVFCFGNITEYSTIMLIFYIDYYC